MNFMVFSSLFRLWVWKSPANNISKQLNYVTDVAVSQT